MEVFDPRVYWEERLQRNRGLEGVGYVGLGVPFNRWMYRVRRQVFNRTVQRHLHPSSGSRVLDVGSGTGEYLRCWKQLGATRITGTDITTTAIERLRAELPDMELFTMDIAAPDPPLTSGYDAVSCMDVLFHIVKEEDLDLALTNMKTALKPGGVAFFSDNFLHTHSGSEKHYRERTLDRYMQALDHAGLRVVERRPMFHLLNRPMDSRSRLLWLWWRCVEKVAAKSYFLAGVLAAIVYPLESVLVRLRREGVSTEIMVCTTK